MAKQKEEKTKNKKLLVIILLSLSFCFVSGAGYGEEFSSKEWAASMKLMRRRMHDEVKASSMDIYLLEAKVSYMMRNPTGFLLIGLVYDSFGVDGKAWGFPEGVDTKDKIYIGITDNRGAFANKSEAVLLEQFKKELNNIYVGLFSIAPDMDTDIVAKFFNMENVPLVYFYQGEYHLWEE